MIWHYLVTSGAGRVCLGKTNRSLTSLAMRQLDPIRSAPLALGTALLLLFSPPRGQAAWLDGLSHQSASVGTQVTITGRGLGATPGWVVLTGRRVTPKAWSDTQAAFIVPEDGVSGYVAVRTADGARSDEAPFKVERDLPDGQIASQGFLLEDSGLPGFAFLVETDGIGMFGVSGFETLSTYELRDQRPHVLRNRLYLNQRIADLRVRDGHLFCVGDHGLVIYRCADLLSGAPRVVAAITGGSYYGVDARPDPAGAREGLLVALSEHAPRWGSHALRVVFYQFVGGELIPLGTFSRPAEPEERQFAVSLDPLNRKAYVSGWVSLTGPNKYLLELDITRLASPILRHREETGEILAGDMDALDDILWTGVTTTVAGNQVFRAYTLRPGAEPLHLSRTIQSGLAFGRFARVRIVDRQVTVGSSWFGNRPDIFLFDTFGDTTVAAATKNSLDWAFDVTGFARPTGTNAGRIIVAAEWGGFMTLDYQTAPKLNLSHRPDYQWVVASAMTQGLHLDQERIYIAGRGAGPWSADPWNLADEGQWRRVHFDWREPAPQPHPVTAVCTRHDPRAGQLMVARGHEKAMAWGGQILALLYRETAGRLELLAQSEAFRPPLVLPGSGISGQGAVWPEPDLVFLGTVADGFRAYVVNPDAPSITPHRDCRASGFATNLYHAAMTTMCLQHHTEGAGRKLIVGSTPGLLVGDPTLNIFALEYPEGVPDRHHPDRPIRVVHETALRCLAWKPVRNLEVRPSGWVAVATSAGVGLFHLSWVPALNQMSNIAAWNRIRVPVEAYAPWWHTSWNAAVADVSFGDDHSLYVVKTTEGVWRLSLELDRENLTQRSIATAYYPGVQCGMDYRIMLHGWADPDIPTLQHPYGVVAAGDTAWVTGWSGKVQRLVWQPDAILRIAGLHHRADRFTLRFTSALGDRAYHIETATHPGADPWTAVPGAVIRPNRRGTYLAEGDADTATTRFYRVRVSP